MKTFRGLMVLIVLIVFILSVFTLWKNGQEGEGGSDSESVIRKKTEDWTPLAP